MNLDRYSVATTIQKMVAGKLDGKELEVTQELSHLTGLPSFGGAIVPTRILASGMNTTGGASGGNTVATEVQPSIVEALRGASLCLQAGARMMTGLQGNVQFVLEASATTGQWVSDASGIDVTQVDAIFGSALAKPRGYAATISFSCQLFEQSTPDLGAYLVRSIGRSHALALDTAIFTGNGTTQPTGIINQAGVQTLYLGTNGGAPTVDVVLGQEKMTAAANAYELSAPAYIATPETRAALKKIGYLSGAAGEAVWYDDLCNGHPGFVTNALPKNGTRGTGTSLHTLIFGYFDSLSICEWGVMSILLDAMSKKKQIMIELTTTGYYDVVNLHPAAFVVTPDIVAS